MHHDNYIHWYFWNCQHFGSCRLLEKVLIRIWKFRGFGEAKNTCHFREDVWIGEWPKWHNTQVASWIWEIERSLLRPFSIKSVINISHGNQIMYHRKCRWISPSTKAWTDTKITSASASETHSYLMDSKETNWLSPSRFRPATQWGWVE